MLRRRYCTIENRHLFYFGPQLQEKVTTLEKSLSHVVHEFETERRMITDNARVESEAARVELAKLQRVIEMKTKEMAKVKRLAKNILQQRTELEQFFLDSLDQVKLEISANQSVTFYLFVL
jgi:succinylglutamate desuccinylase